MGANRDREDRQFGGLLAAGSPWLGPPAHGHAGLVALALNPAVVAAAPWPATGSAGTLACNRLGIRAGADLTGPADYTADEDDPTAQQLPELVDGPLPYRARHAR